MNKFRIFIVALVACMFILVSKVILVSNVYAFTNSDYYDNQNISIGLKSMARSQLDITLNGDYTVNGVTLQSGTSYVLKVSGGKIDFNGAIYDSICFIPKTAINTINIVSNSPSYSNCYLGEMIFKVDSSSEILKVIPINTLNIEDYLKGVVGKEMSNYFPVEALKAQAIAARNYALASILKHKAVGFNVCDTTDCQVYGGYDASLKNVTSAVDATKGILLLNGDNLVSAFYFASDGGYTEASANVWNYSITYLKAKIDSYDGYDTNYLWEKTYTDSEINGLFKLKLAVNDTFVKIDLDAITKFESGRIENITLIFKKPDGDIYPLSYGKEAARTFLYLKSALYDVSYDEANCTYTFNGKGIGHGVGMSQIGAMNRAKDGQSYEEILGFYYDGTTLMNALKDVKNLPIINNISVDKDKIHSLDYPNFTVDATGGSGKGLTYKYVIEHNNITVYDGNFITSSNFQYKPLEAGSYNLKVYVKDIDSELPFEDTKTYIFNVEEEDEVAPTGIIATSGYNSILLEWTINPVNKTSGYEVHRATSSDGTYDLISEASKTSYNDTGLTTNSTYYYKVRAYRMLGTAKVYSDFSTTINSKSISLQRLAGSNRTETSIAIAIEQYSDKVPDAVVLATANNFADALAGSGIAYKYNAPLLLVNKTISGSKNVLDYITTNLSNNKNIYILGGTGAVSEEIAGYLTGQGYTIIRLGGNNRYETNQEIVNYLNSTKGTSVVIATGGSFADALSISSIADIKGYPILLNGKDNLSAIVSSGITNIQPKTVYIIGEVGVLSANIETQIKEINAAITIVRLGGKNRYETSMKIMEYFNLTTDTVTIATGIDFPDALSGSVLAARRNCSVLLVDNKDVTKQKELLSKQKITNVIVFGGEGVIGNDIAVSLMQK